MRNHVIIDLNFTETEAKRVNLITATSYFYMVTRKLQKHGPWNLYKSKGIAGNYREQTIFFLTGKVQILLHKNGAEYTREIGIGRLSKLKLLIWKKKKCWEEVIMW